MLSPLEAIESYEKENDILPNWINFAISYSNPNGHWQRLERGEIQLDDDFFKGFGEDLRREDAWKEYHAQYKDKDKNRHLKLKDLANLT